MVRRFRLPRLSLHPFKDEKEDLLERFNEAVKANNPEDAKLYYEELKQRGFAR
jgi:hypothetical protein